MGRGLGIDALHCRVVGKSTFIECDNPIDNLVGCCRQDRIAVVHLFFSARDVGKQQHPLIAAAVSTSASSSFFQISGRSATAFLKPSIRSFCVQITTTLGLIP
jgi:hypothetical protein